MATPWRDARPPETDGLTGEWLTIEQLAALDLFKGTKRTFKGKLNTNLGIAGGKPEPTVKAVVKREYKAGDIICRAGDYGSTAFLLLEGTATAFVPEAATPAPVPQRTSWSLARLTRTFVRRTSAVRAAPPGPSAIGEVSAVASLSCTRPPEPTILRPGDFFGIDSCINLYPRETTVRAEDRCVVVEMLRSVVDTIREGGDAREAMNAAYREQAIRTQLYANALFADVPSPALEGLAGAAELLGNGSDQIKNNVVYAEGQPADALYLVRSGTIKLSQQKEGGEFIFTYLGRGAAFGFEAVLPVRPSNVFVLQCVSHPGQFPAREIGKALTLGRSAACDVHIASDGVSRQHCRLEPREGELYLIDNNSRNFTLLNGERITEAILAPGDKITIVDHIFELQRQIVAPAAAATPPRVATATGLDNFEVVRLPAAALARLAQDAEQFLATAGAAARELDANVAQRTRPEQATLGDLVDLNLFNSQNVLLIDLDRCTRCDECVRACSTAHGGVARFTRDGPRFGKYLVAMACRSCTDPKCMVGCPVGSIRRTGSLEIRIEDWCVGCERCANQCPFGNINMFELAAPPEPAPNAIMQKATVCDLCSGYDGPNCVYACPHDAAIRVNPAAFLSPADRR